MRKIFITVDLLLHISVFVILYYFKYGNFQFSTDYINFIQVYTTAWFISGLIFKKFPKKKYATYSELSKRVISSAYLHLGLLSFGLLYYELIHISRYIVLLLLGITSLSELLLLSVIYIDNISFTSPTGYSRKWVSPYYVLDQVILIIFFVIFVWGNSAYESLHYELYCVLLLSWLFSSFYSQPHKHRDVKYYFKFIYPHIRSVIFFSSMMFFLMYILKFSTVVQLETVIHISYYAFIQLLIYSFIYLYVHPRNTDEIASDMLSADLLEGVNLSNEEHFSSLEIEKITANENQISLKNKLNNIYLYGQHDLYNFIKRSIDFNQYDINNSTIIRSSDAYNVDILSPNSTEYFMNLHEINDIRRINKYFILLNSRLKHDGVYVGCMEPIDKRYKRFTRKYPKNIANILYIFDFIWKRVCPKIPVFQKLYFAITNGKDRALSKSEGLGRLYYCGFNVIAITEYDNLLYYVAKKKRIPNDDKNPSYSPIVKMKRVGKHRKDIFVYKFRTMHPYAEYLQDFIITNYGYSANGKPANDFRLTSWGKFMRKYWLDELPQIINVAKGEMKLVGIRPVSQRFLDEYPPELVERRLKYKPGCIPAYVALNKQGVEEFIEAEREYLADKKLHPLITDFKYFIRALNTIFIKKMRSA